MTTNQDNQDNTNAPYMNGNMLVVPASSADYDGQAFDGHFTTGIGHDLNIHFLGGIDDYNEYYTQMMGIKHEIAAINDRIERSGRPAQFQHSAIWLLHVAQFRARYTDDGVPMDIKAATNSVTSICPNNPYRSFPEAPDEAF